MAEEVDSRGGELEVSPEEERFLKRFFRRQLLPWMLVLVVTTVATAWTLRGGDTAALEARTSAALAQLRTENQRLREEVEGLSGRLESGLAGHRGGADELERKIEDAKANVRMIESRVSAKLDRRVAALEGRLQHAQPARAPLSGSMQPPPDASAWDVSAILDRLYALEMRQDQEINERETGERSNAARIGRLEQRVSRMNGASGPVPAAAAPLP